MNPEYFHTIFLVSSKPEKWPNQFAIITAYNPMDQPFSPEVNHDNTEKLWRRLGNRAFLSINGCSLDLKHQEKGFGFLGSLAEAEKIGTEFNQRAIYYISNDNLGLIDCNTSEYFNLGKFEDRVYTKQQLAKKGPSTDQDQ